MPRTNPINGSEIKSIAARSLESGVTVVSSFGNFIIKLSQI